MKPAPFSVWIRPGQSLPAAYEQAKTRHNNSQKADRILLALAALLAAAGLLH